MWVYCGSGSERMGIASGGKRSCSPIGEQIMDYIHHMREEDKTGESKGAYAARIYAKIRSGQKLTLDELSYLARTDPVMYQKALRAQAARKALENSLKGCKSRREAQDACSLAVSTVSEQDPDREIIVAALTQAYREFQNSEEYFRLPEKAGNERENEKEDEKERSGKKGNSLSFQMSENGYQEAYLDESSSAQLELDA